MMCKGWIMVYNSEMSKMKDKQLIEKGEILEIHPDVQCEMITSSKAKIALDKSLKGWKFTTTSNEWGRTLLLRDTQSVISMTEHRSEVKNNELRPEK